MQYLQLAAAVAVAAMLGCAKGEQAGQSADSTARNLTLAPTESTAAMKDVPEAGKAPAPGPEKAPEKAPPPPPAPAAPSSYTLSAGTGIAMTANDSITTRKAKAGDAFSATISADVKTSGGHVVIPAGSAVSGTIVHADPAPNPRSSGRLELSVTSVTIRGKSVAVDATVDSKDSVMQGRGVTGADAGKVGGGAAIGAIAGKLIGKNTTGALVGGALGAAAGGVAAERSRDIDVVLPKGANLHAKLNAPVTVAAH